MKAGILKTTAILSAVLLALAAGASAEPRAVRSVTELLPAGALAVLRVKDGASLWAQVAESPFARRLQKTALWAILRQQHEAKNRKQQQEIRKAFGMSGPELVRRVAGRDWALAMYPGDGGKPQVLVAARAIDATVLANLVVALNAHAEASGAGKYVQFSHEGVIVMGREGRQTGYLFLQGEYVVFGRSKAAIKRAASLAAGKAKRALATDGDYTKALKALPTTPAVSLYVRPAKIAATIRPPVPPVPAPRPLRRLRRAHATAMKAFMGSVDWVAAGMNLEHDAAVGEVVVRLVRGRAHPLLEACTSVSAPVKALRLASKNTVLLAGAKVDVKAAYEAMRAHVLEMHPRAAVHVAAMELFIGAALGGRDFRTEILPLIGPEAAVLIERPDPRATKAPVKLPRVAVLVEIRKDPVLRTSVGNLLRIGGATLSIAGRQATGEPVLRVDEQTHKGVKIYSIAATAKAAGHLPKDLRELGLHEQVAPAFAYAGDMLVLASHPSVIRQLVDRAKGRKLAPNLAALLGNLENRQNAVFVLDTNNLAAWMKDNLPAVRRLADQKKDVDGYMALWEVLRLFKGVSAVRYREGNTIRATMRLQVVSDAAPTARK
jgi:hypothetical protein